MTDSVHPSFGEGIASTRGAGRLPGIRVLKQLSITNRLNLGFGILLALILFVSALGFSANRSAIEAFTRLGDPSAQVTSTSSRAQVKLVRMLADVQGYLAVGDPAYRADYEQVKEDFEADLAELEALLAKETGEDTRRLDELQSSFETWSALPARLFELRDTPQEKEQALRSFQTEAAPQAERMLRLLEEMGAEQQAWHQADLDNVEEKLVKARRQSLVSGALAFLLGMVIALLFRANILGPIRRLTDTTRQYRDHLEELVEARTAKLKKTNQRLSREIAERVQAESHRDAALEALRESEERYRTVSELSSDYADALRVEPDGSLTRDWVTGAFTRITGYAPDELPAQDGWKLIVHPDDHPIFRQRLEALLSGQPNTSEYRIITKSGEVRWLRAHGRPIWDESGRRVVRYVGAARDVTERVRAEEQAERYATQLAQSNEELRQFTYIVSHDLRAPLVNLKGFAAELRSAMEVVGPAVKTTLPRLGPDQQEALATALEEDIPEALGFIDSSVTRMDHFINALLELSRLGRRQLNLEPIDMQALAQATRKTLAHQIEARGVTVNVGTLPEVIADRISMEQIVGNLLDNAVKYLDPERPGLIEITAEVDHAETRFQVRDNGRGIAEEDVDKVFAPFRRAGRQDVPGEGMGLPSVQVLVRRHGGRIWCDSELGVETSFIFSIPHDLK